MRIAQVAPLYESVPPKSYGGTERVEGIAEAVQALERIPSLSCRRCRAVFEQRFSATRMAQDYMTLYQQRLEAGRACELSLMLLS